MCYLPGSTVSSLCATLYVRNALDQLKTLLRPLLSVTDIHHLYGVCFELSVHKCPILEVPPTYLKVLDCRLQQQPGPAPNQDIAPSLNGAVPEQKLYGVDRGLRKCNWWPLGIRVVKGGCHEPDPERRLESALIRHRADQENAGRPTGD